MTNVVVKEIDNEEPKEEAMTELIQEEATKEEEKPEEIIEQPVQQKPQPAPKPKVRPSRAKQPFDPEAFKNDLVKQLKEELQSAMSARDTYNKAKEEKNEATREKNEIFSVKKNVQYYIYKWTSRNRKWNSTKQTAMKTSARTSTEDKPSIQTKVPTTGAERQRCQTEEKSV